MSEPMLKLLQFLEYYLFLMVLMILTGTIIVWDITYLYLGNWAVEGRIWAVILPAFGGSINIFRTDNKVLFKNYKIRNR